MSAKKTRIGIFEGLSVISLIVFLVLLPDVVIIYPAFVFWHGITTALLIVASFVPWSKLRERIKANIKKAEIRRAYYLQATMRERVESNMYKPKKTRK